MTKHFFILCAYLIISSLAAFSQPKQFQKIYLKYRWETKNLKDDTNKVLTYLKFAKQLEPLSADTVLAMTKKAKELSLRLNYQRGIELSVFEEGIHAEIIRNYPLAMRYYNESVKIAESRRFYPDIFLIYNSSLNVCYYQADYAHALEIAQKGLSLAGRLKDKEDLAHYNNEVGFIYQKQNKAEESIRHNMQYLKLAYEIHNSMMIADASNSIADGYLLKHSYQTSLTYFFKALGIYNKMNDEERLDRERMSFKRERIAYTLYKISTTYKQAGDYKRALQYALIIIGQYDKRKGAGVFNQYDLASYYINTGDIYRLLNEYKHAGIFLNKGLTIARSILHREDIRDAYVALSKNFAGQKRYDSAFYYHVLFTQLKDSIINEKVSREINHLAVERKDKEITLLNQQQKLEAAETARQNIKRNFIVGIIALIAIVAILLLYVQNRIKNQTLAFEKRLAIQAERQRISSDMHDDIGTGLSTMLIYVNMLKLKLAKSADEANIDRIAALGTGLVDQMKEIVWSLNPGNDRLDSLLLFMRQYFALLFEPLPYTVKIIFPMAIPDIELEGEVRRNIFLCFKEALNNVIKHARATAVEMEVNIIKDKLLIRLKDNGAGLTAPSAGETTGNGLKNIRKRMSAINGKFNISNDNGTVVQLELELSGYPNG